MTTQQDTYERVMEQVRLRLASYDAVDIVRKADTSTPFGAQTLLAQLIELAFEVTPAKAGATHQYVGDDANEAVCAVCGSTQAENAPECTWK